MSKNLVILLFVLLIGVSCGSNNATKQNEMTAVIEGVVVGNQIKAVNIENFTNSVLDRQGQTITCEVKDGKFNFELPVEKLMNARISIAPQGNWHHISLLPGDNMKIKIDGDVIKYEGKGAVRNNFHYDIEKVIMLEEQYFHNFRGDKPIAEALKAIDEFSQKRVDFLKNYKDFAKIEKEFVDCFLLNNTLIANTVKQRYPSSHARFKGVKVEELEVPEEMKKLNNIEQIIDDAKLVSPYYLGIVENAVRNSIDFTEVKTRKQYDQVIKEAFNKLPVKTKEFMLAKNLVSTLRFDHYDSSAVEAFNQQKKTPEAIQAVEKALKKYHAKRIMLNAPLTPEFIQTKVVDSENHELSFGQMMKKYEGKVVYLDIWSKGCGPCVYAMKYSKVLKNKLKGLPVEFVYISVRNIKPNDWKSAYDICKTDKNQYFFSNGFNSKMLKKVGVSWIPCYMMFDKKGNLVNYNAPRPDEQIEKGETKLEKKLRELAKL
jgi:thiol-disulfide isomerase/thioredoxin